MKDKIEENVSCFRKVSRWYDAPLNKFILWQLQKPVVNLLPKSLTNKILDVGCGTGELLLRLSGKVELFGCDLSPDMLKVARKKLRPEVDLKECKAEELPYADNFFDYVVSTGAFHHFFDQNTVVREMRRVVKPGGLVIISDPKAPFDWLDRLIEKYEPGCVKINNQKEMREIFKKNDLAEIHQSSITLLGFFTAGRKS